MTSVQIYKIAKEIWFPELGKIGFISRKGRHLRLLDSGVVHLIGIGKDPHGAKTVRVMCGVNAEQLYASADTEYGFKKKDGLYHLTPRGWDYNSGRWPCDTEEETRASLTALLPLILNLAIPYFEPIRTLSDVGNEVNETQMPGLGWMKARLYMLDGDLPRAREAIERYAAWAAKPRNWGTKENQQEDISRAEQLRQEVEAAASGSGD